MRSTAPPVAAGSAPKRTVPFPPPEILTALRITGHTAMTSKLANDFRGSRVERVLRVHGTRVLITKAEHDRLAALGLARTMPPSWDGADPLARYMAAGIELLRNTPQITVQLGDRELSVGVARGKIPALLKAVERCRAVLK